MPPPTSQGYEPTKAPLMVRSTALAGEGKGTAVARGPICHLCNLPIEYKGYRIYSIGKNVAMHLNCAYSYWHKKFDRDKPMPFVDTCVYADVVAEIMCCE